MKTWLCLLLVAPLTAQTPPWKPILEVDAVGSIRPDGLQLNAAMSLQKILAGTPSEPQVYLQVGGMGALNAAYGSAGLFLETQPAPFLVLRTQAEAFRYFGAWGALLSFARPTDAFGKEVLEARKGQEEVASGRRLLVQATPQFQIGQLVARHQITAAFWRFTGRGPWFYELENDTLLRNGDRILDQQTSLAWESLWTFGKTDVGPTFQTTRAKESTLVRRRLGLAFAFESAGTAGRWGKPRGGLVVGRNRTDRNRQGDYYLLASLGSSWSLR